MKTISLKLPEELDARLSVAARRRSATRSAVVRAALEAFLRQRRTRLSCLDLAKGLVGCVSGSGDLSYSKRHLEGFGQ